MRLLSLFSGIGAFEKALERLEIDYELVGFSEIDKWAIESYSAIHDVDTSLNLGDVGNIRDWELPNDIDMITYGFPCQDISIAGNLEGIDKGTRSGLLYEAERIIQATKPKFAIAENVKNLVSRRFRGDFEALLERLERLDSYGYNSYWRVLNARDYGIPQNRERVFIVSIRKDIDIGIFDFPVPMDLELRLKDVLDKDFEDKYIIDNDKSRHLLQILDSKDLLDGDRFCTDSTINDPQKREVSNSIIARYGAGIQNQKQIGLVVVEPCALRYERNEYGKEIRKAYENGEVDAKIGDMRELSPRDDGVSNTLTTVQKDNLILVPKRLGGLYDNEDLKKQAGAVWDSDYLAPTLSTMQGGHREPLVVVKEGTVKGFDVATEGDIINLAFSNSTTRRGRVGKGVAQTLDTSCSLATLQEYTIRKLTPLECWRLMGFDDEDYWKARKRLEDVFYGGNDRSNSQMYKQAGNSIVVDVLESIFRNLPMD